jgi:hypothetical protein
MVASISTVLLGARSLLSSENRLAINGDLATAPGPGQQREGLERIVHLVPPFLNNPLWKSLWDWRYFCDILP